MHSYEFVTFYLISPHPSPLPTGKRDREQFRIRNIRMNAYANAFVLIFKPRKFYAEEKSFDNGCGGSGFS
jgi:hypothetical protein